MIQKSVTLIRSSVLAMRQLIYRVFFHQCSQIKISFFLDLIIIFLTKCGQENSSFYTHFFASLLKYSLVSVVADEFWATQFIFFPLFSRPTVAVSFSFYIPAVAVLILTVPKAEQNGQTERKKSSGVQTNWVEKRAENPDISAAVLLKGLNLRCWFLKYIFKYRLLLHVQLFCK